MEPDYINVDVFRPANADGSFLQADLTQKWPWEDGTVDHIRAHDIIEHMVDKVHTMNEIHRVLKPGGTVDIFVPTTEGRGADQDPTHVSYWNRNSFLYHTHGDAHYLRFKDSMGLKGAFQVVSEEEKEWPVKVWKLRILLRAVK